MATAPKSITDVLAVISNQTGTSYTLQGSENGKVVVLTNASDVVLTLPADMDVGFSCILIQGGAGQVALLPDVGAALFSRPDHNALAGPGATASLLVISNTGGSSAVYSLAGDTADAGTVLSDLYPTYDGAFDPVNSFYKIGDFLTGNIADFLDRTEVVYSVDPTASISSSGYIPADGEDLYLELGASTAWSVYTEQTAATHEATEYNTLLSLTQSSDITTRLTVVRNAFSASPIGLQGYVVDAGTGVGSANIGTLSGDNTMAFITSGASVKWFFGGSLIDTTSTTLFADKPMGRMYVGDYPFFVPWNQPIKRILWRFATDADSEGENWTA